MKWQHLLWYSFRSKVIAHGFASPIESARTVGVVMLSSVIMRETCGVFLSEAPRASLRLWVKKVTNTYRWKKAQVIALATCKNEITRPRSDGNLNTVFNEIYVVKRKKHRRLCRDSCSGSEQGPRFRRNNKQIFTVRA